MWARRGVRDLDVVNSYTLESSFLVQALGHPAVQFNTKHYAELGVKFCEALHAYTSPGNDALMHELDGELMARHPEKFVSVGVDDGMGVRRWLLGGGIDGAERGEERVQCRCVHFTVASMVLLGRPRQRWA